MTFDQIMEVNKALGEIGIENIDNVVLITSGATNGDIIKALFPDCEFEDNSLNSEKFDNTTSYLKFKGNMFTMAIEDAWWNAPYKRGDRE